MRRRLLALPGLLGMGIAVTVAVRQPEASSPPAPVEAGGGAQVSHEGRAGLAFRLREGEGEASAYERRIPAASERLSEAETQRILERLPALEAAPEDKQDFALREGSLPAPRSGARVRESFPPKGEAAAPEPIASGPLEVLRKAPADDVPLAPHLSVTFSQPMVAVTSQAAARRARRSETTGSSSRSSSNDRATSKSRSSRTATAIAFIWASGNARSRGGTRS